MERSTKDISLKADGIIKDLNEDEVLILTILGRLLVSRNKNVNEHTIKNKLPNTHLKSFSKNMKKLKSKKLISVYRKILGCYSIRKSC